MNSFKHLISYACDKNCSYCINEILVHGEKQEKNHMEIGIRYAERALDGYDHIMISGGEPVINKMFDACLSHARMLFKHVSIITAHESALSNKKIEEKATDILFSLHQEYLDPYYLPAVLIDIPVYASMVLETYQGLEMLYENPLDEFKKKGFAGATLRECYPDGITIKDTYPDGFNCPKDFSLKFHTKDNCTKDSLLLLPDLSLSSEKEFS